MSGGAPEERPREFVYGSHSSESSQGEASRRRVLIWLRCLFCDIAVRSIVAIMLPVYIIDVRLVLSLRPCQQLASD